MLTFVHLDIVNPDVSTLRLGKMKLHSDKNLPLRTREALLFCQNQL